MEIKTLINENLLKSKTANSLLEVKIWTPEFPLLPKIHKDNNPGRPIISPINCHTNRIWEFHDYYLQPEIFYWVSLDIHSLYTNIPHQQGIEGVKQKLQKSKPRASPKVILSFLKLILTLNNFAFNSKNYL